MNLIFEAIYFLLPAGFANMAPVLCKHIPLLKVPVHAKWFGKNKTWRGIVCGILFAMIVAFVQSLLPFNAYILYSEVNVLMLGFLLGLGAMLGDLVESFVKRRLRIKPGERFIFFDQTDWVMGALIVVCPYVYITWTFGIVSVLTFFVLHITVKHLGFYLGIEKAKW